MAQKVTVMSEHYSKSVRNLVFPCQPTQYFKMVSNWDRPQGRNICSDWKERDGTEIHSVAEHLHLLFRFHFFESNSQSTLSILFVVLVRSSGKIHESSIGTERGCRPKSTWIRNYEYLNSGFWKWSLFLSITHWNTTQSHSSESEFYSIYSTLLIFLPIITILY